MSKAKALLATPLPIRPMPITPRVLPFNSTPVYCLRFHSPFCRVSLATGIWRAIASIIAKLCSVAALVLPPGELITTMPLAVAAATSILSTPTPARPIIFKFLAASITSAVTLEAERTINASKSGIISSNSSAGSLSLITHSKSSFKMSTAVWDTPSAIKTFMLSAS